MSDPMTYWKRKRQKEVRARNRADVIFLRCCLPLYVEAKAKLRSCAEAFTPDAFEAARAALSSIEAVEECDGIASPEDRVRAYLLIANDNDLSKLTGAVSAARAVWEASK